jgi:hypothetical protein
MEEMTLSCDRLRAVLLLGSSECKAGGCDGVGDCEMVSDEHCGEGEAIEAVMGAWVLLCCGSPVVGPSSRGFVCCCSHIARVLGSTGQLDAESCPMGSDAEGKDTGG